MRSGGIAMVYAQINAQTERDLLLMESIAIPLSFLVLVWVFGGLIAAALPMVVGGLAIVGSMSVLRLITFSTDVSIFALNLSTALGLALAIDYTLLIISRYRDELADGMPRDKALIRTMSTAGRTVLFSATTVALSMAAMLMFPMYFLKSFAYAGIATVAFAAAAAVIVTPAAIWLLGDRLDALDVRATVPAGAAQARARPQARRAAVLVPLHEGRHAARRPHRTGRRRAAARARRPVPRRAVGFPGRPGAAHVGLGASGRRPVAQRLQPTTRRPRSPSSCPTPTGCRPPEIERYAADLSRVPDVSSVSGADGHVRRRHAGRAAHRRRPVRADGSAFLTVGSTAPLFSDALRSAARPLARRAGPDGRSVADDRHRAGQPRQRGGDHRRGCRGCSA